VDLERGSVGEPDVVADIMERQPAVSERGERYLAADLIGLLLRHNGHADLLRERTDWVTGD
jgi:hypothetical protein